MRIDRNNFPESMTQETTPAHVAQDATQHTDALGGALTLLGTFGSNADLSALLKYRNGTTETIRRGDTVRGRTVLAIEESRIALSRNGQSEWLEMPRPAS